MSAVDTGPLAPLWKVVALSSEQRKQLHNKIGVDPYAALSRWTSGHTMALHEVWNGRLLSRAQAVQHLQALEATAKAHAELGAVVASRNAIAREHPAMLKAWDALFSESYETASGVLRGAGVNLEAL